jgi:hypothetical protein
MRSWPPTRKARSSRRPIIRLTVFSLRRKAVLTSRRVSSDGTEPGTLTDISGLLCLSAIWTDEMGRPGSYNQDVAGASWVNSPESAERYFATIGDPVSLVYDVIGDRDVDDAEDCAAFLLERLWRLALTYNPKRDERGPDFNGFANFRLRRFGVTDYLRSTNGRTTWQFATHTHQRDIPVVFSLDHEEGDGDAGGGLGTSVAEGAGDPQTDSDPAFRGLVADRDRRRVEDLERLGLGPAA